MSTNVIFFGTPNFVIPVLTSLIDFSAKGGPASGWKVVGIVSAQGPMKLIGIDYGIKVYQPQTLREEGFFDLFKGLKPDLSVVAAYGKIIPKEYLEIPKYGFLNIHPSLLPKYRGPTPCQYTILNGDKETGVTIMKVDEEMDHGPIVTSDKLQLTNNKYNSRELCEELFKMGADLLIKTLPDYIEGKIKPIPQDHSQATFTHKLTFQDGKIDWNESEEKIVNKIRAFNPEPGAWTKLPDGKILKIIDVGVAPQKNTEKTVAQEIIFEDKKFYISAKDYLIEIKTLQPEGRKIQTAQDFINGHKNLAGQKVS